MANNKLPRSKCLSVAGKKVFLMNQVDLDYLECRIDNLTAENEELKTRLEILEQCACNTCPTDEYGYMQLETRDDILGVAEEVCCTDPISQIC
jgi:hypothetical protein